MITTVHKMTTGEGNRIVKMEIVEPNSISVNKISIMSIDGSTSCSGIAIIDEMCSNIYYSIACEREKGESAVRYKIEIKNFVKSILSNNKSITRTFYEEPIIAHKACIANLMMLRTFLEEMVIENEPQFNYLVSEEVPNKSWKKAFLEPEKVPVGTDLEKKAIRDKLLGYMPILKGLKQDEFDAIAMGLAVCLMKRRDKLNNIISNKKATKFSYIKQFIGADCDEEFIEEFLGSFKVPARLEDAGLRMIELSKKDKLDNVVFESLRDKDGILIVKYESGTHGNITLENKLGNLISQFDYIYIIIYRKYKI